MADEATNLGSGLRLSIITKGIERIVIFTLLISLIVIHNKVSVVTRSVGNLGSLCLLWMRWKMSFMLAVSWTKSCN